VTAGIPLADAPELRRRTRPARALTTLLAAAAIGSAVAALLVARSPHTRTLVPLGHHANAIVVLDVSASISADTFSRIAGTLRTLSASSGHFALVVFSDIAYEALPPGTPAADLAPLIRFFTLPPQRGGQAPNFPPNPWSDTFTGGTSISSGMQLALALALAEQPRPTVVLVSDLDDNVDDLPALAGVLADDRRDHVPVRVVGLNPAPGDVAFFAAALGGGAPITLAPTLEEAAPQQATPFPWVLVVLAILAAVTLGLRAVWAPRLDWRGS
jgi:hypothetical protein